RSLQQRDPILVMGENDIRIIPAEQIWKTQVDRSGRTEATLKPQFAGEQIITTAILAINDPQKRKVAFIRPGGPPLTEPGFLGMQQGVLSEVGQRLRDYNFEVLEKDVSGQWAIQSQMRGMAAAPEPDEEQLKDAIWVVLAFPTQAGLPAPVGAELKRHLDRGGSALVIVAPRVGGLEEALSGWGIEVKSDLVAVHEAVEAPDGRLPDEVQDALRSQMVFLLNEYGDHVITRTLRSLDSLIIYPVPVTTRSVEKVAVSPILPLITPLKTWGESDQAALEAGQRVTFEPEKGDLPGPLTVGAAAEKEGAGRLVVIGCPRFAFDFPEVTLLDSELAQQNIRAARFPGNAELFMNAIFWLAKMDSMIAISPAAMEVSRIRPMSVSTLNAWRIGLLLVGIPGAVVAAGIAMYFKRRD
ncbi:MAG: GldG family protein, partial [Phycisphaerae bacterium]|nr:GldG family protein [Phycisphaerae bacterium]